VLLDERVAVGGERGQRCWLLRHGVGRGRNILFRGGGDCSAGL
jgi:hypothetical protein